MTGAGAAGGAAPAANAAAQTLAERLGYTKEDRLLLVHADDLGMCHSVNEASTRALTADPSPMVTCASVMVPCPWFPEIAAWSREHPQADLGLHLTLTSEWRYYRWRPVAPYDQVPSLLDDEGFLPRDVAAVKRKADPKHVEIELRAQIARARRFGMKPTHVDSHMGTLFADDRFFEAYTRVAKEEGVLPMLMEPSDATRAQARALGLDYDAAYGKLKGQGFVFLDLLITGATANTFEGRKQQYHAMIRALQPGVTEIIVHLSGDDPEIRHITGAWQYRWNEFRIYTDPETRALLRKEKIKLIGYRHLAKLWPHAR